MDENRVAEVIWQARQQGLVLPAPSTQGHPFTLSAAYRIQRAVTALRLAAGERVVGWKLGYTSAVMREQMGIDQPNYGPLTDVMALDSGAVAPSFLRQPRVEPEVALVMLDEVRTGVDDLAGRVEARASLEVVDSSWSDYQFDLGDNTADSSSAGAYVLGERLPMDDPAGVSVRLEVTDQDEQVGTADAAMGNPLAALAWLLNQLAEPLPAGSVVLTGGLTRAIPLEAGGTARAVFTAGDRTAEVTLTR
ncbi:2-keto-4-pentenoate hydratase [Enemella sp. A6]|uniref:2-keto-4-pentenoate hydratase n=1 Tax=Enemella sp. A6 TaxID=3440152 RepID=UPI003EC13338